MHELSHNDDVPPQDAKPVNEAGPTVRSPNAPREEIQRAMQRTADTQPRKRQPEITDEQWDIARKAASYCVLHFPTLWTAGVPKAFTDDAGPTRWVIPVVLRYPTGHAGEIGRL